MMKLSPFLAKVIVDTDTLALFHSLNMEALYIRENLATLDEQKLIDLLLLEAEHKDFLVSDDFQEAQYLRELTDRLNTNVFTFTTLKMFTTTACNLNCKYCLIKKNIEKRDVCSEFLSYEKALETLEFFCNLVAQGKKSHRTLMLYGGEPLLNWANVRQIIS